MTKVSEYCSKITETEINESIVMTKKIMKVLKTLLNVVFVKENMRKVQ